MRSEAVYSTPIVRNYDQTNHYSTIGTAQPTQSPVHFFQVNFRFQAHNLKSLSTSAITATIPLTMIILTRLLLETSSKIPTCIHVNMKINQLFLSNIFVKKLVVHFHWLIILGAEFVSWGI